MLKGLRNILRKLFRVDMWTIGIAYQPIHAFLDPKSSPRIYWLPMKRKDIFAADPFGAVVDGRLCILCEKFDFRKDKGIIAAPEFDSRSLLPGFYAVLDFPSHISYPYLIEHEGNHYMIPETSADMEVALFKAERFPNRWEKAGVLIEGVAAVDSTVFKYNGRWWMMFTDGASGPNNLLHIWHAPDLLGPWEAHAANPVKDDIFSSRPGGTPFEYDGALYRPAQDCSRTYGGAIVLNRVLTLTPTEFAEEKATVIRPQKDSPCPDGLHTLSSVGGITLIDGKRCQFNSIALKVALIQKAASLINGRRRAGQSTVSAHPANG